MQFLLIKSKIKLTEKKLNHIRKCFDENNSILSDSIKYEWISKDFKTFFIGKNPNLNIYKKFKVFNKTDNNMIFIHGWVKHESSDELSDIDNFNYKFDDLDGYYNFGIIDSEGSIEIYNSKLSPSIYYAKSKEICALSNRILILSELFSYKDINKKYVAAHIQYQSSTITFETMFDNIFLVPFGSTIKFCEDLEIQTTYDYLHDPRLKKLYLDNKEAYWDECYKKLKSQAKAFTNLGIENSLTLGITGGKDSRLLLSLYHDIITSTFTWGPVYSPEVIIGKMVCDTLNIQQNINNVLPSTSYINLMELMPIHIFDREFEVSPWDFGSLKLSNNENVSVIGHEYIRIKPYGFSDKDTILNSIKDSFKNTAITDEYNDDVCNYVLKHANNYLNNLDDLSKFSIIKKQLERGRWASKAHETNYNHTFWICPLVSNVALTYAYNIPKESMAKEEFHYELIKRANKDLLEIPFFNETFELYPVPPIQNKIPGKLNYKNIYLMEYFEYIKNFIENNFVLISDIVKKQFIEELSKETLFNNPILSEIIYNILQYIILLKYKDSNLKNKLNLNWDIEIKEENSENLDDLTLKALVEYNKEITNIKKDLNTTLFEKYNTCRVDLKNMGTENNKIEILNISDFSSYSYPPWFKDKFGEGLKIQSSNHVLDIELKCIGDGELNLYLKSMDIRTDYGKKIPIFIKYNKLMVNNETIFDEEIVSSLDDYFQYKIPVSNLDHIKLHIEWMPF